MGRVLQTKAGQVSFLRAQAAVGSSVKVGEFVGRRMNKDQTRCGSGQLKAAKFCRLGCRVAFYLARVQERRPAVLRLVSSRKGKMQENGNREEYSVRKRRFRLEWATVALRIHEAALVASTTDLLRPSGISLQISVHRNMGRQVR